MRTACVVVASLLLACCSGGPADGSPADAMETFLTAVQENDCESARAVVVTPSAFACSQVADYDALLGDLSADDASFTEKSRAGSSAIVTVTWPEGSADFEVEQVEGAWKVLLDTAA